MILLRKTQLTPLRTAAAVATTAAVVAGLIMALHTSSVRAQVAETSLEPRNPSAAPSGAR